MSIISWEYYSSLNNEITEAEFEAAEVKAEQEIRQVIGPIKWDQITEETFGYVVLQDCVCNVINKMQENARLGLGQGVTSVNNDGYSETYAIKTPEELKAEMGKLIRIWLSGTGLIGAY